MTNVEPPPSDEHTIETFARHESGHWVVLEAVGAVVRGVIARPTPRLVGTDSQYIEYGGKTTYEHLPEQIDEQICVALAGYAAEGRSWRDVPGSRPDIANARALARQIATEADPVEAILDQCQERATHHLVDRDCRRVAVESAIRARADSSGKQFISPADLDGECDDSQSRDADPD